jgi:hypothetical protein
MAEKNTDWVIEPPAAAPQTDDASGWVIEKGINSPGYIPPYKSALRGAAQGATFGLSDEGAGVAQGVIDWITGGGFGTGYEQRRDSERKANKEASEANPKSYIAGEVAGGVAVPFGLAKVGVPSAIRAAEKAGLGARMLAGGAEGAAYGGAYGFGKGEGAEGSAINALQGAAVGAPLGAALPPVIDAARGIASKITTPIRAVTNPTAVGNEKMVEALFRDSAQPGTASDLLQQTSMRLSKARKTTPEVMLADVGGENTRGLLRSAANMPSEGAERLRKTLDFRQSNQWRRIERGLEANLADPSEYASSLEGLIAKREAAAKPAFDAAFKVPVKADDKLVEVLQRPGMKSILERVVAKMENEGTPVTNEVPMRVLHRAKMEIDKAIGEVKRGQSNTAGWDVRTLAKMKGDLVDAIPNPQYKAALKAYSGDAALMNAAEDGLEQALKLPTEEIRKTLTKLGSDAEREMWRLGASRAIAGKVRQGNVMRDRTESIFGSPDMQLRLKDIFPDNASRRQFQKVLVLEAKMSDTRKAVQGNSTTAKQLTHADEAGQAMRSAGASAKMATGRLEPVLHFLGRQVQRFSGMTPAVANAVVKAAMQKHGSSSITAWEKAVARAEREPAFRAELVRRIIAASGAGAPNESAPNQ